MTSTISTTAAPELRTAVFDYDVGRDGGVGQHPLRGEPLPEGAVITDALIRIEQVFTLAREPHPREKWPTLAVRSESSPVAVIEPVTPINPRKWPVGRLVRSELASQARAVPAGRLYAAVGDASSGGFAEGALLVIVTYLPLGQSSS